MVLKNRFQIALWTILAGVNIGFASNIFPMNIALPSGLLNVTFLALVFYANYFFIFPRYFRMESNYKFFIITFAVILTASLVQCALDLALFSPYAYHKPPRIEHRHVFVFFKGFFWLWLIDLISIVFLMQDRIREQMLTAQKMKEEKLNTELKLLKAQINPHFVFNALNNIYSLTYTRSDNAPDSILKLSQMLRYVLEECENDRVSIQSEIEYVENFISFQRMKSPGKQDIVFKHTNADPAARIAPMLLIPFIENSFKYSKIEEADNAFVHIVLDTGPGMVRFSIINSIAESGNIKPGAGMGIINVQQRLDILYPDKYVLDISPDEREYHVLLEITL